MNSGNGGTWTNAGTLFSSVTVVNTNVLYSCGTNTFAGFNGAQTWTWNGSAVYTNSNPSVNSQVQVVPSGTFSGFWDFVFPGSPTSVQIYSASAVTTNGWQTTGHVLLNGFATSFAASTQIPGDETSVGAPFSAGVENGYMNQVGTVDGPALSGLVTVAKSAVRTPVPFLSQHLTTFIPGPVVKIPAPGPFLGGERIIVNTTFNASVIKPVNQPPGEYVYTPDTVGGFGFMQYSTDPAPSLPQAH